jgi:ankyrin repeat protein
MEWHFISQSNVNHCLVKIIFNNLFDEYIYCKKDLRKVKKLPSSKSKKDYKNIMDLISLERFSTPKGKGELIIMLMEIKNIEILKYVVENYLHDMLVLDDNGSNILFLTSEFGFLEFLIWLVDEKKMDINEINENKETVLFYAAKSNNLEILKWLIFVKKIDVNHLDKYDNNILYTLCLNNNFEIIRWIVENTDINYQQINYRKENCLFGFAYSNFGNRKCKKCNCNTFGCIKPDKNRYNAINYLVNEKKININKVDTNGYTLLFYSEFIPDIEYLIDQLGMNITHESKKFGTNILFSHIQNSNKEIVSWLINERKLSKDKCDNRGTNLLLTTIKCENPIDMINWLISKFNFDINYRNKLGYNLIYTAAQYLNFKVIDWLIEKTDIDFYTPLYAGYNLIEELLYNSCDCKNKKSKKHFNMTNFCKTLKYIQNTLLLTKLEIKEDYVFSIYDVYYNIHKNVEVCYQQTLIYLKQFKFNINTIMGELKNETYLIHCIKYRLDNKFIKYLLLNNDEIDTNIRVKVINEKDEEEFHSAIYFASKYQNLEIIDVIEKIRYTTHLDMKIKIETLKSKYLESIKEIQELKEEKISILSTYNKDESSENLEAYIYKLKLQLMLAGLEPEEP